MSNREGIILKLCCSEDIVRTVTSVNEGVTGVFGLRVPRTECPPACKWSTSIITPYRFIP